MPFDTEAFKELSKDDLCTYFVNHGVAFQKYDKKENRFKYVSIYETESTGEEDNELLYYKIARGNSDTREHCERQDFICNFDFPSSGYYNDYYGEGRYFYRRTNRQWDKGISQHSCTIYSPVSSIEGSMPIDIYRLYSDFRFMWNQCFNLDFMFGQENYGASLEENIGKVVSQKALSRALNLNFAIVQGLLHEVPEIYFREKLVGLWSGDGIVTELESEFHQELIDFFPQNGVMVSTK